MPQVSSTTASTEYRDCGKGLVRGTPFSAMLTAQIDHAVYKQQEHVHRAKIVQLPTSRASRALRSFTLGFSSWSPYGSPC